MKVILFLFTVLLIASCTSKQQLSKIDAESDAEQDSISYELIVLDPGFETWFVTKAKPSWFNSQEYYESWNRRYVDAWNHKNMGNRYAQLLDGLIDYDSKTDYGLEINHKLFYYFQYVENELKIPIISRGPRLVSY